MLYEQTPVNLEMLVREIGVVHRVQLVRFFSDVETERKMNYYIKCLMDDHKLIYEKEHDILRWHASPRFIFVLFFIADSSAPQIAASSKSPLF